MPQVAEQQSPLVVLPSSHCSPSSTTPLPQVAGPRGMQTPAALHVPPVHAAAGGLNYSPPCSTRLRAVGRGLVALLAGVEGVVPTPWGQQTPAPTPARAQRTAGARRLGAAACTTTRVRGAIEGRPIIAGLASIDGAVPEGVPRGSGRRRDRTLADRKRRRAPGRTPQDIPVGLDYDLRGSLEGRQQLYGDATVAERRVRCTIGAQAHEGEARSRLVRIVRATEDELSVGSHADRGREMPVGMKTCPEPPKVESGWPTCPVPATHTFGAKEGDVACRDDLPTGIQLGCQHGPGIERGITVRQNAPRIDEPIGAEALSRLPSES